MIEKRNPTWFNTEVKKSTKQQTYSCVLARFLVIVIVVMMVTKVSKKDDKVDFNESSTKNIKINLNSNISPFQSGS